ncbi:SET domain-containing protein [Microdochium bolleyi]|uniref:SET domain-containing protein n=1 Tax=Microdochium bolleyi TaxID=196109 RepID=A0A136J8U7_9PEZI|nr:SET domain-containing protein [Microdochium bolleyi]
MADADFDSKTRAFLSWFQALPGATFHPAIEIQDLRGRNAGRGIVATQDIPEDTVLFSIPRDAIINVLTSDLPKKIPGVFEESTTGLEDADNEADEEADETSSAPDSWVSLILVLLYEFLQGDQSRWKPYLDVLPQSFDTLMFWSNKELDELQASAISAKVGRDEAENMFRARVFPLIEQHADIFYPAGAQRLSEEELLHLAHKVGSTIMAYAFDLEKDEEDEEAEDGDEWVEDKEGKIMMGMVPMADILNADAKPNAHINHGDDALTATSLRPIAAGTEILNYYGPLGNGELLRRYGYVTETHSRHDVVEIPWTLVSSVLKDVLAVDDVTYGKAMNEIEEEELDDIFILERDLDEPDDKGEISTDATMKHLPADIQEQIATVLKAIKKVNPELIPDKQKRDELLYTILHRVFELRLAQYPTPIAEDEATLVNNVVSGRQQMANVVRWGEKVLLREAIRLAQQKKESIVPNGHNTEPSSKRQRR